MSTDPRTRRLSETAAQRGPNRPLFTKGGPPNYVEKSLTAAAEPFKGITSDGNVIPVCSASKKLAYPLDRFEKRRRIFWAHSPSSSAARLSFRSIPISGASGAISIRRSCVTAHRCSR